MMYESVFLYFLAFFFGDGGIRLYPPFPFEKNLCGLVLSLFRQNCGCCMMSSDFSSQFQLLCASCSRDSGDDVYD